MSTLLESPAAYIAYSKEWVRALCCRVSESKSFYQNTYLWSVTLH